MTTHSQDETHGHDHGNSTPHGDGHEHRDPEPGDGHDHGDRSHVHEHEQRGGVLGFIEKLGLMQGHSHATSTDDELESSEKGIRTVKLSLVILASTAAFQIVIVLISGSVALFADT